MVIFSIIDWTLYISAIFFVIPSYYAIKYHKLTGNSDYLIILAIFLTSAFHFISFPWFNILPLGLELGVLILFDLAIINSIRIFLFYKFYQIMTRDQNHLLRYLTVTSVFLVIIGYTYTGILAIFSSDIALFLIFANGTSLILQFSSIVLWLFILRSILDMKPELSSKNIQTVKFLWIIFATWSLLVWTVSGVLVVMQFLGLTTSIIFNLIVTIMSIFNPFLLAYITIFHPEGILLTSHQLVKANKLYLLIDKTNPGTSKSLEMYISEVNIANLLEKGLQ